MLYDILEFVKENKRKVFSIILVIAVLIIVILLFKKDNKKSEVVETISDDVEINGEYEEVDYLEEQHAAEGAITEIIY